VARWGRMGISVSGTFVRRCLNTLSVLRFHIPLVEPDVRFSRIRLSDKVSCLRPRKVARPWLKPGKSKYVV